MYGRPEHIQTLKDYIGGRYFYNAEERGRIMLECLEVFQRSEDFSKFLNLMKEFKVEGEDLFTAPVRAAIINRLKEKNFSRFLLQNTFLKYFGTKEL
jgi:truncated hemoglobin YjbI